MAKKNASAKGVWIGFDLGGTKMLATVLDRDYKTIGSRRRKTKGDIGASAGVERIVETIDQALAEARLTRRHVRGIGMGVPGMLDLNSGVLKHAPNLGWHDVPLRRSLEKIFKVPVAIANDVDAGTYGEYRFGAGRKAHCCVGVFPGTGIGGACIYNGHIIRGKTGSCMEIGHITVQPGGSLCGCGRRGCLETVASRLAISAELAMAAYRGETPRLLAMAGTELGQIRSGVIAAALKGGEKTVERIVRYAARKLGQTMVTVVHLLNPDVLVLGGGLVEEMPEIYRDEVDDALKEGVMPAFRDTYKVVTARLGDLATAMGAAALAEEETKAL